jgi:DNA modification methylase
MPAGGGGGGWAKMNEDMAANRTKRRTAAAPGLTWVGGNRNAGELDDTSRRILEPAATGTSIFDPALCELAYRWFCPPGGLVLDPFAGGSVRGIVAAKCGRLYIGIDLSERLVAANRAQAEVARQAPKMHILVSSRPTSSLVFDHPLLQSTVSPLSQRPAARPAN